MTNVRNMESKVYFKQVAFIGGKYFSVYEPGVEYVIGETLRSKPRGNHKGGFFVYGSEELAAHAEIKMKTGSNWIFPRIVLKVQCWGELIQYPRFKLCFEYIKPVQDLGFPIKYLKSKEIKIEKTEVAIKAQEESQINPKLIKMKKETAALELEVIELENRAKLMGIKIK